MRAWIISTSIIASGCDVIFTLHGPPTTPAPLTCSANEECESGRCECGACSVPDPTCTTTNRRWIAGSPGALDEACVPAVEQIDTRVNHTCAAMSDGTAWCWGSNPSGQLGAAQPIGTDSSLPILMLAANGDRLTGVVEIRTGVSTTCARLMNGSVVCWGDNMRGQLGAGLSAMSSLEPVPVALETGGLLTGALALTVGFLHACAILPSGLVCWGHNGRGQIGDGSMSDRPKAVVIPLPPGNLQRSSAGGEHTCVLLDGLGYCWGRTANGRLGNGVIADTSQTTPVAVANLTDAARIAAGNRHTCAVRNPPTNDIECWGANGTGTLGNGSNLDTSVPLMSSVPAGEKSLIAADDQHTCATNNNDVYCWGSDTNGEIGDGPDDGQPELAPKQIVQNDRLLDLTTGFRTSCSLGTDRVLHCWGTNDAGQLGLGDTANRDSPTEIPAASFCPTP